VSVFELCVSNTFRLFTIVIIIIIIIIIIMHKAANRYNKKQWAKKT